MAESLLQGWRSQYLASVKEVFRLVEEHDSLLGRGVGLEERYPKLRPLQVRREEDYMLPYSGTLLEQAEVGKSSQRYSPSNLQDLFVPDRGGFLPKTVVLVGPPGIGKTRTSQQIMLDWASGNLYADNFLFVFYLSAREINKMDNKVNIAGLVAGGSTPRCSDLLIKAAFSDPSKVLLIVDGFEELRWTLEDDYEDCDDPFQDAHKETFLRWLFSKDILRDTSLILTARSMCLQKMKDLPQSPCSIELVGFSDRDLQQYVHHFFQDKDRADEALSLLVGNEVLVGLCRVPLTCWLVCSILKAGMKCDLVSAKTLTSVYLLYLRSFLLSPGNKRPECVKNLCALANEGILNQRSLFDEEDLGRYGLTLSEVASVFPNDSIFQRNVGDLTSYSFLHLTVQEFLAALYYVLGEDAEVRENNGGSGDTFLPKVCQGRSLFNQTEDHPWLTFTVRFLFGLLNDKQLKEFAVAVGSGVSLRAKPAMEEWLGAGKPWSFCLDVLSCFYEAQDLELCRRAFSGPDLVFQMSLYSGTMENVRTTEMLYCLEGRQSFGSISLEDHMMRPKDLQILSPFFHRSSKVSFTRCGFAEDTEKDGEGSWLSNPESKIQQLEFHVCVVTTSFFQDLRSLLSTSRSLAKLELSHHRLEDPALQILCDGLCQPGCTLRELTLDDCNLTSTSCHILGSAIRVNRSLHKLDLALNKLEDGGVKSLCEGLKEPGCALQELRMDFSALTPACCEYLCSALLTNRSLTVLYMRDNDLQDSGAKLLCEALRQPDCPLEELRLQEGNLSSSSCNDFLSVLLTSRTLTTLDLTYNKLEDSGVKLLCEGLRHSTCVLRKLVLCHCDLSQSCCEDLGSALLTSRSLTSLDLTWNNLEDSGVRRLCESLRDPRCVLEELRLSGCALTSSSLRELSSVVVRNGALVSLDVSGNKYEEEGVREMCGALSHPRCALREFRVGYCTLTTSSAEHFLGVVNTNQSLTVLDVSFGDDEEEEEPPADLDFLCRRLEHPACTLEKSETQDGTFIYFKYRKQK